MRLFRFFLAAVLLTFSLATQAGASDGGTMASLTGQVMYHERMALRPGSIVTVKLVGVRHGTCQRTSVRESRVGFGKEFSEVTAQHPGDRDADASLVNL